MKNNETRSPARQDADDQDGLNDVVAAYGEAALQALHIDDLLGHIPVFKTGLAAARLIGSLRDHLLLKKLGIFLRAISAIPAPERRAMVERLAADPDFNENVGEHLIELLDRMDGRRKPAMIGAAFSAFAFEEISVRTLRRLNSAIQSMPAGEVGAVRVLDAYNKSRSLPAHERERPPERESMQAIANAGLAEPTSAAGGIWYDLNETGTAFLKLELDRINPS